MRQPPTHPGEMLMEEFLRPLELSQAEAATRMQMTANRLNEIIKGKRGVTADTAWRLSALLGTSPELWMNLQMQWDLWHAASAPATTRRWPMSSWWIVRKPPSKR